MFVQVAEQGLPSYGFGPESLELILGLGDPLQKFPFML